MLAEYALAGLHDQAFDVFRRHVRPGATVIDLGAGTGAWAQRLTRAGYRVSAVEKYTEFGAEGVPLRKLDLDEEFAAECQGPFDAVTSIEVIEHLESPGDFLRQCKQLLAPHGILFVCTPNVESLAGRLRFLVHSELRQFGRNPAFNEPTHISPILTVTFERLVARAGLRVVERVGDTLPIAGTRGTRLLVRLAGKLLKDVPGNSHMFVLTHAAGSAHAETG